MIEPPDLILDPDALIKFKQVGTATQQHVLAVINHLTRGGMLK